MDSDPIENCGPSVNSKQTVRVKRSECKNYTDCGFINGTWIFMTKSECDKKQAEDKSNNTKSYSYNPTTYTPNNYPPCTIYYPALGYSQTYNYTSPSQCQIWKNQVSSSTTTTFTQPPAPSPASVDNSAANSKCKYDAGQWYNTQVQNANNLYGDSSAAQAVQQIARSQADAMIKDCDSKYPI